VIMSLLLLALIPGEGPEPLLSLTPGSVHRIELDLPEGQVLLSKRGTQWLLPDWSGYPAEIVFAESLVRILEDLPAGTVIDQPPAQVGLEPVERRVSLFDSGGAALGEIRVGHPTDGYRGCYIARSDGRDIRRIDVPLLAALMRPTWGSRTVWRISRSVVREIRTEGFDENIHIRLTGETAELLRPVGHTLSEETLAPLLAALTHLRAGDVALREGPAPEADARIVVVTPHTDLSLHMTEMPDGTFRGRAGNPTVVFRFDDRLPRLIAGVIARP